MDRTTCNRQRPHTICNQHSGLDDAPRCGDGCERSVLQSNFRCELWGDFAEQLRLQFCQVAQSSRHAARRVVLCETIRRENIWEAWITWRLRVNIVLTFFLKSGRI